MSELELIAGIGSGIAGMAVLFKFGAAALGKVWSLCKRFREPEAAAIVMPPPSSVPFLLRRPSDCDDHSPYSEYIKSRMRRV